MYKNKKRFVLNSAVITTPGEYSYKLVSPSVAKTWLEAGSYKSTIGYEETAIALEKITDVKVPVNRENIHMTAGDEALVFRLTKRLSDPILKGSIGIEEILANVEIGILTKTGG